MTAKRDSKSEPKKVQRPKLKKEKVKDLDAKGGPEGVKGGGRYVTLCSDPGC